MKKEIENIMRNADRLRKNTGSETPAEKRLQKSVQSLDQKMSTLNEALKEAELLDPEFARELKESFGPLYKLLSKVMTEMAEDSEARRKEDPFWGPVVGNA